MNRDSCATMKLLKDELRSTRIIFEFTRQVSRVLRNLIAYSRRDTLTAQDSMSTGRKA